MKNPFFSNVYLKSFGINQHNIGLLSLAIKGNGDQSAVILLHTLRVRNEEHFPGIVTLFKPSFVIFWMLKILLDEGLSPHVNTNPAIGISEMELIKIYLDLLNSVYLFFSPA